MKLAIGSDKSGFAVKEAVKSWLQENGMEFDDLGTVDLNDVHPYYRVASEVAPEGVYSAKMARAINNANVLCMGGWIVGPEMAVEMVRAFLNTAWCQDLEDWRAANMHKFAAQVAAIEDGIYGA